MSQRDSVDMLIVRGISSSPSGILPCGANTGYEIQSDEMRREVEKKEEVRGHEVRAS